MSRQARQQWKRDYELARCLMNSWPCQARLEARIRQMGSNARAVAIALAYVPPAETAISRYRWRQSCGF